MVRALGTRDALGDGPRYLRLGFAMWRRRPGLMLLGMLPALLVFVVLATAIVVLAFQVGGLVAWATPFADDWPEALRGLLRLLLGAALVVAALLVAMASFVALTLIVGDPFYERVWKQTELMLGGPVPDAGPGFVASVKDGAIIGAAGAAAGVMVFALGFLPVIGTAVGVGLGIATSGRFLARELVQRPLEARGLDRHAREALIAPRRRTVLGFGVSAQLFFLIPLAAIVMMPAAVVGSTYLARDLLAAADATRSGG